MDESGFGFFGIIIGLLMLVVRKGIVEQGLEWWKAKDDKGMRKYLEITALTVSFGFIILGSLMLVAKCQ